jgi:haloacetate dehalogenase
MTDMATIHAMCEDYRASASIDLAYDEADQDKKIRCPLRCAVGRVRERWAALRDVLGIWKNYGVNVTGKPLPGGHNLQEDVPDMVVSPRSNSLLAT